MNLTAKSRYALKILLHLEKQTKTSPVQRAALSKAEGIPIEYMDQIIPLLKKSSLIKTSQGPKGGLLLQNYEKKINIWQIFTAVEKHLYPVQCLENSNCTQDPSCSAQAAWKIIYSKIKKELSQITLDQINNIDKKTKLKIKKTNNNTHTARCQSTKDYFQ
ncbi:MAG: hypothetical protein CMP11_01230 [Zetaproteobacteria bacterium]|nr:hypothetical protein [Pseudobdellovibrionaceae bacterium]|tara:strand:+ start:258 stop:740 length:483 start_codon:yes stop_codon:yes gene_type:complete